jgi:hypothetical protein
MWRPFVLYEFAPDPSEFLIYEKNCIFFFISVHVQYLSLGLSSLCSAGRGLQEDGGGGGAEVYLIIIRI